MSKKKLNEMLGMVINGCAVAAGLIAILLSLALYIALNVRHP